MSTLTSTSTSVSAIISTLTTFNYTYNTSQSEQITSSESGLSSAYIGLIVALIGLAGTFLVQYNIKTVKLCCVNFECTKKIAEAPVPEQAHLTQDHPVPFSVAMLVLEQEHNTLTESSF